MLTTALTGALVAISFSAPPGPVTMETIRRGMRGGFGPALRVQLGSIIGDSLWCGLALLGLAPLAQIAWVRGVLGVAGVAVLVILGALGIRDALKPAALPGALSSVNPLAGEDSGPQARSGAGQASDSRFGPFRSGMAISLANPMAVGYWLSVGGALAATAGAAGTSLGETSSFIAGFVGGALAWAFGMAFAVRWGKQIITPAIFRAVSFVCGATLLVFGSALAARMFGTLL